MDSGARGADLHGVTGPEIRSLCRSRSNGSRPLGGEDREQSTRGSGRGELACAECRCSGLDIARERLDGRGGVHAPVGGHAANGMTRAVEGEVGRDGITTGPGLGVDRGSDVGSVDTRVAKRPTLN